MLKASIIASIFALSVFGAPVLQNLQARHGEDALVAYLSDAKIRREPSDNDALVAYISDGKVKREPANYVNQAAAADASDVLGKREPSYVQSAASVDKAAVLG